MVEKLGIMFIAFMMLVLFSGCSGGAEAEKKITSDDPEFMAELSYKIGEVAEDNAKLAKLFKEYGYSLSEGSKEFRKAYKEITEDKEKNRRYQKALFKYMRKSIFRGESKGSNAAAGVEKKDEKGVEGVEGVEKEGQ